MRTTVLLTCAGNGDRWKLDGGVPLHESGYLGVPKQLAPLAGEPVLVRTCRQLHSYGLLPTVIVPPDEVGKWEGFLSDVECRIEPAIVDEAALGMGRYLWSRHLWNPDGRTLVLHGDVWWSDEAMASLARCRDRLTPFMRFGASRMLFGKPNAELFGWTFTDDAHSQLDKAMAAVVEARRTGLIRRGIGLELYRALHGKTGADIRKRGFEQDDLGYAHEVDDLTDDLDKPEDHRRALITHALAQPVRHGLTSVCIPWREDNEHSPERPMLLRWVLRKLEERHPDWEVVVADDCRSGTDEPWSASTARTNAVARSHGDVLVFLDADVWSDDLTPAVDAVRRGVSTWLTPNTELSRLGPAQTRRYMASGVVDEALPYEWPERPTYRQAVGSVPCVVTRARWLTCPQDQRFLGWGAEDTAWGSAMQTLGPRMSRLETRAYHLYHTPSAIRQQRMDGVPPRQRSYEAGHYELREQYRAFRARRGDDGLWLPGQPEMMRRLIAEQFTKDSGSVA